jgi:hypothetical protein
MKRNLSDIDRIVRVVLAALFGYLYFAGIATGALGVILALLGVILLFTSVVSFCPLYAMLKLSTYNK